MAKAFVLLLGLAAVPLFSANAAEQEPWPKTGAEISYNDRTSIMDLLTRYALYVDAGKGEAFASTFTEDGELIFQDRRIKGQAALARHASRKKPRTLHFQAYPLLVQMAPGRVRARTALIFAHDQEQQASQARASKPPVFAFAVYEDDIVLTPQGWRFAARRAGQTLPVSEEFLPEFLGD